LEEFQIFAPFLPTLIFLLPILLNSWLLYCVLHWASITLFFCSWIANIWTLSTSVAPANNNRGKWTTEEKRTTLLQITFKMCLIRVQ
jgi:hypothetical protein